MSKEEREKPRITKKEGQNPKVELRIATLGVSGHNRLRKKKESYRKKLQRG